MGFAVNTTTTAEGFTGLLLTAGNSQAVILPEQGALLYSTIFDGQDYMDRSQGYSKEFIKIGSPLLFPTPNRIADATYTFGGKTVVQKVDGEKRIIHGLVHDMPFTVCAQGTTNDSAFVSMYIEFLPNLPRFDAYPYPCRLTVTWTLFEDRIQLDYLTENLGQEDMPFGFAWHPFLSKPDAKSITLRVESPAVYEAVECFPTGKLLSVKEYPQHDISQGTGVLSYRDGVYTGITPTSKVQADYADLGKQLDFFCTPDFKHVVVYTPSDKDFFCIENQTCSTDAINLYAKSVVECNLIILAPGQSQHGSCGFVVRDLK